MSFCYLLIGTNLGNREASLRTAEEHIFNQVGKIVLKSSIYKTEAWGYTDQPYFFNRALKVDTKYSAEEVFKRCQSIEKKMGRIKITKWGERIIDIDILFFDQVIINTKNLIIPHPFIPERRFTLETLCEIAPDLIHPVLSQPIKNLLSRCTDSLKVEKLNLEY